jgi:hypothetical protein
LPPPPFAGPLDFGELTPTLDESADFAELFPELPLELELLEPPPLDEPEEPPDFPDEDDE